VDLFPISDGGGQMERVVVLFLVIKMLQFTKRIAPQLDVEQPCREKMIAMFFAIEKQKNHHHRIKGVGSPESEAHSVDANPQFHGLELDYGFRFWHGFVGLVFLIARSREKPIVTLTLVKRLL